MDESELDAKLPRPRGQRRRSIVAATVATVVLVSIFWTYVHQANTARSELKALASKKVEIEKEVATITQTLVNNSAEVTRLKTERALLQTERDALRRELEETQVALEQLATDFENAPPDLVIKQVLASSRGKSDRGRAMALYTAGRIALEQGRQARAKALFQASVDEYGSYAPALTVLGRLAAPSDQAEAERLYRDAIAADPQYKFAKHNLAHLLYMQRKNSEALDLTRDVLRIDPNFDSAKKLQRLIESATSPH